MLSVLDKIKVVPLRHNLFYLGKTFHDLFRHDLCVLLCCLNIGVAQHL